MRDDRRNGISRRSLIVKGLAAGGVVAAGGAATLLSEADNGEAANSRPARRVTRGGVRLSLIHI